MNSKFDGGRLVYRVWDATDMVRVLCTAFSQLYPGKAESFQIAEQARSGLAQRLKAESHSVLVVLKWTTWRAAPSTQFVRRSTLPH